MLAAVRPPRLVWGEPLRLLVHSGYARRGHARNQNRPRAQESSEGEPDWEAEVALFKQRTMKPSQLEVQRKIELEKVDVGRVSAERTGLGAPPLPQRRRRHPLSSRPAHCL